MYAAQSTVPLPGSCRPAHPPREHGQQEMPVCQPSAGRSPIIVESVHVVVEEPYGGMIDLLDNVQALGRAVEEILDMVELRVERF